MALFVFNIHTNADPALLEEIRIMSEALDRLTASVAANQSATDSVLQLVSTLAQEIRDNVDDSDALNALADKLDTESASIANAVTANTTPPPAPAPTPAPQPEPVTDQAPTPADPNTPTPPEGDPVVTGA